MALDDEGVLDLVGEYQARSLRLQCLTLASDALKSRVSEPAEIVALAGQFYDFIFLGKSPS